MTLNVCRLDLIIYSHKILCTLECIIFPNPNYLWSILPSLFSVNDFQLTCKMYCFSGAFEINADIWRWIVAIRGVWAVNNYWMTSKQSCSDARPVLNFTHDIHLNVTYLSSSVHLWQPKQLQWLHPLSSSAIIIARYVCVSVCTSWKQSVCFIWTALSGANTWNSD